MTKEKSIRLSEQVDRLSITLDKAGGEANLSIIEISAIIKSIVDTDIIDDVNKTLKLNNLPTIN